MKTPFFNFRFARFILVCVGSVAFCLAASAQAHLEVVVKNIKDATGSIRVGVYNDESQFLKKPWSGKIIKAEKGDLKVIFENVPAGTYAVSIIHDENDNTELDSNFVGIPKEGFGFSNDAMGTFGPPSFEKASFKVTGDISITISTRYF